MSDRLEDLKAALVGRYEIEREIGHGGMATVYLATDVRHHRQVAVKVLRPDLAAALGPERFLREIEIAANLTHPHILPLHDSGEADGFLYYVMPYIKGHTLRERIEKEGELPISEAVRIIREVADALAFAHSQGVVHRDIKPDNVMLSGRHAMVMDFGVAKAVSEATGRDKITTAGVALGTPAYMSPEQATADQHVDRRSDIYAVGAMAYELLAGRPPFQAATAQGVLAAQVTEQAEPVSKHRDQVSPQLEVLVMRCLAKKPADRWQSADEMLAVLDGLTTTSGGITPIQTRPVTAVRARNRNVALIAAALVGAGLVAAAGFLLRGSRGAADAPAPIDRQVTFRGDVRAVALARDGRTIAYQAEEGRSLIVQDLEGGGSNRLVHLEDPALTMGSLYWGPDDSRVFFNLWSDTSDVIASVPRLGGPLRTEDDLLPLRRTNAGFWGFTASGEYVISFGSWIYVGPAPETLRWVSGDSLAGDGALLRVGGGSDIAISVLPSPDGRWIAYGLFSQESFLSGGLVAIDGTRNTVLTEDEHGFMPLPLGWTAGGEAAYYSVNPSQGNRMVRVPIDPTEGIRAGDPTEVYTIGSTTVGSGLVAGETLVYVGGSFTGNIMAIDLAGAPRVTEYTTSMLTRGTALNGSPALSPDGDTVLFQRITTWGEGTDIYQRATESGAERLVAHRPGYGINVMPAMSPDGRRLAFYELGEELGTGLVVLDVATGRATELPVAGNQFSAGWSPDGQQIATKGLVQDRLTLVTLRDSSEYVIQLECDTTCTFGEGFPVYSPDGNRVALMSFYGLWIVTLQDGHGTRIVDDAQRALIWTEDWLFFAREETPASGERYPSIYRIPSEGGDPQLYARMPVDCAASEQMPQQVALSQDASMAVCAVIDQRWDVHVVENFDAGPR